MFLSEREKNGKSHAVGLGWRSESGGRQNQGKHGIILVPIEFYAKTGNHQANRDLLKMPHLNVSCWQCYVLALAYRLAIEQEGKLQKKSTAGEVGCSPKAKSHN